MKGRDLTTRCLAGWLAAASWLWGCAPEKPPAPEERPAQSERDAPAEAAFDPTTDKAVFTYAAKRGTFADTSDPEAVPEEARGLVRVSLLGGEAPPAGMVWVANLQQPRDGGRVKLTTVPRDLFEELALGQGLASEVELPEGLEVPEHLAAPTGDIVVYKTSWCGVCKKVEAYLDRKGVPYEAKDIEQDREAAAELQAKARASGMEQTGSVPVIDVRGELIVGFDRARLERLLGAEG